MCDFDTPINLTTKSVQGGERWKKGEGRRGKVRKRKRGKRRERRGREKMRKGKMGKGMKEKEVKCNGARIEERAREGD